MLEVPKQVDFDSTEAMDWQRCRIKELLGIPKRGMDGIFEGDEHRRCPCNGLPGVLMPLEVKNAELMECWDY